MELLAILTGLGAALSWGAGDFAGGLGSRRAAAVRVVLASQFIGTLSLVALGLALGQPRPAPADLLMGAVAGLAGGIGLVLLYLSLARGKMGVAAPLTAVASGGIPLLVGLASEGLPEPVKLAGFLLALAAVWTISRAGDGERPQPVDVVLPLLAGVGFGVFLAIIGRIEPEVGFVWPLVAGRLASMSLMAAAVWLGRPKRDSAALPASSGGLSSFPWMAALVAGLGDTVGNALFVWSSQLGRLDVAAVLGALYPAATVALARLVLGERLSPRQQAGVGMALGAVVLIAL